MKKGYIFFGAVVCVLFIYASMTGLTVTDSFSSGKWGPKGHSAYHK